jgi:hypothetical protein
VDRIQFVPKPGKSNALNAAVAEATSDILAFTDDDALPASDWLRHLCQPLLDNETLSGVGGQVQPIFEATPPKWYRRLLASRMTHFLGPVHFPGGVPFDYAVDPSWREYPIGCNCAYRRSALLEIPFPTALGPNIETGGRGGEDFVLARLLLEARHRIRYEPKARLFHPVDPDRTTLSFVRKRYEVAGWEWIEMERAVGASMPKRSFLARRVRKLRWWKRLIYSSSRHVALETRAIEAASALARLDSLASSGSSPGVEKIRRLSAALVIDTIDDRLRATIGDIAGWLADIVVVGPADALQMTHEDPVFTEVRFYARPTSLSREEVTDYALDQAWGDWVLLLEPGERVVGDFRDLRRASRRRNGPARYLSVERNGSHRDEPRLVLNDASARYRTGALPGRARAPMDGVRLVS